MSSEVEHTMPNNVIKLRDHFEGADDMAQKVEDHTAHVRYGIMGWLDEQFMSPDELWNHVNTKRLEIANIGIAPVVENQNVIPLQVGTKISKKAA